MKDFCEKRAKNFSLCEAEIIRVELSSSKDFRLQLKVPMYRAWQPGQFVMLRWGSHVVGRPFAIVNWIPRSRNGSGLSELSLWVRRLGAATEELFQRVHSGMRVSVMLPLGTGFDKKFLQSPEPLLFVSGGVGAASLIPLFRARKKLKKKDYWIHGERHPDFLDKFFFKLENPQELFLEEGKLKKIPRQMNVQKGLVTAFFQKKESSLRNFSKIVVCGPTPLLHAVHSSVVAEKKTSSLILGVEEKMACGIGLCFSCSVPTVEGPLRSCLEGPWFFASQLAPSFFENSVSSQETLP